MRCVPDFSLDNDRPSENDITGSIGRNSWILRLKPQYDGKKCNSEHFTLFSTGFVKNPSLDLGI